MKDSINKLIKLVRELQNEIKSLQKERDYWRDRYINEVLGEDESEETSNPMRKLKY